MLAISVCFPQSCSSAARRFASSWSRWIYYQIIGSFPQKQIRWNALQTGFQWIRTFIQTNPGPNLALNSQSYSLLHVGLSFNRNLNLKSQSHWSLFNGTWQKWHRGLDHQLRFDKGRNDTPNAIGCSIIEISEVLFIKWMGNTYISQLFVGAVRMSNERTTFENSRIDTGKSCKQF